MTDESGNFPISRALDEIFELRRAMAYEAEVLLAHLDYATFPKHRRKFAEDSIRRLRQSACGHVDVAYAGTSSLSLRGALLSAGAPESLVRHQWEAERDG